MKTNSPVQFFKESVRFRLNDQEPLRKWILSAVKSERFRPESVCFIFCPDNYLLKMNRDFLAHDYFTDIITFDHSPGRGLLGGDIFISVDRVRANAKAYGTTFRDELHRVMIHGVLHLAGYKDKKPAQQKEMRKMEDHWLGKRKF